MKTARRVTLKQAQAALDTLAVYGSQGLHPEARPTLGQCVGLALARTNDSRTCLQVAVAMLEDWNAHLSAAAILAIENHEHQGDGRDGVIDRNGRFLRITLPEHWETI